MKIQSESVLEHPPEAVFGVYRDHLPDVVRYLDDIREIQVAGRQEDGEAVRLHNIWISDREVPSVAQRFIKPEHLRWDDFADWNTATKTCSWRIEPHALKNAVKCSGKTILHAHPRGTRVELVGDLEINVKGIPGIPSFLAGTIAPQVEKFIIALITPNLQKTNEAVGRFLDDQG